MKIYHLTICNPKTTANKHKIRLREIYNIAVQVLLPLNKLMFSKAKLEKVVNPPQNPIAIRYFSELSVFPVFCRYPNANPIIKLPKTFTVIVCIGNLKSKYLFVETDIKYLKMLPAPPPNPTNNICLNMLNNFILQNNQKIMRKRIYSLFQP